MMKTGRGGARVLGVMGLAAMLGCGCPPPGPRTAPGPSGEVLANHLSHAVVRCGARTGVSSPPPGRGVASAPVLIRHQHHVGASYRLQSLRYALSGVTVCRLDLAGSRALETGQRALAVFRGRLPVGAYVIRQHARYRGYGVGVFSYLKGYRFRVAGGGRFEVRPHTPLCVDVYSLERHAGSLSKRLHVRIRLEPNCLTLQPALRPTLRPAPLSVPPSKPAGKKVRRPGDRAPGR